MELEMCMAKTTHRSENSQPRGAVAQAMPNYDQQRALLPNLSKAKAGPRIQIWGVRGVFVTRVGMAPERRSLGVGMVRDQELSLWALNHRRGLPQSKKDLAFVVLWFCCCCFALPTPRLGVDL